MSTRTRSAAEACVAAGPYAQPVPPLELEEFSQDHRRPLPVVPRRGAGTGCQAMAVRPSHRRFERPPVRPAIPCRWPRWLVALGATPSQATSRRCELAANASRPSLLDAGPGRRRSSRKRTAPAVRPHGAARPNLRTPRCSGLRGARPTALLAMSVQVRVCVDPSWSADAASVPMSRACTSAITRRSRAAKSARRTCTGVLPAEGEGGLPWLAGAGDDLG